MNTILDKMNLDAAILLEDNNRKYYTGFMSSFGAVLLTKKDNYFFTDFRYGIAAKKTIKDFNVIITKPEELNAAIGSALRKIPGIKNLGFEDRSLTVKEHKELKSALSEFTFKPLGSSVLEERAVKTKDEIQQIKIAQKITEDALLKTMAMIRPGVSEADINAELTYQMIKCGADELAFNNIVAFQENTADCHHVPTDKKLSKNDIITIDCGARKNGYCSDMTRTFCLGEPLAKLQEIYSIVLGAQNYILSILRAGYTGRQVDMLCREYFRSYGYEKEFGHSLGHGVGIQIHELPNMSTTCDMELTEGNIVTVEPGLYVDGLGGVRIEDMVLIKKDGIENLTAFKKSISI
ncbi:MAG: aminopeptidase P family protein [Clostridia bacterium]|nr:aminopeptidase P family protein [Clostridia bacterium]MBP5593533.1 aminopeptidase P family protein [Clostridia bacterium]MBP5649378.1 aminopeptidase P family protein [Clostridia bacterium]